MYSFYGGQEGRTYHIVKSYPSVAAMDADFSSNNTQVMYHQYVLIDTTLNNGNINDDDNGKLYRRGFSGSEYVGNIRGKTGNTADIVFTNTITATNTKTYTPVYHNASVSNQIATTYGVLPSQGGRNPQFQIKLDIPYPHITASASTVAYNSPASASVTATEPYKYNVSFDIPKGVPGTSFSGADIIKLDDDNSKQKLSFNVTTYNNSTSGNDTIQVPFPTISSISLNENNTWVAYYNGTEGTGYASSQQIGAGVYTRAVMSGSGDGYKNLPSSATVGTSYSTAYVNQQNWGWPTPAQYCILVKKNESQDQYILVPVVLGNQAIGWRVAQDLQGETEPRSVVELNGNATISTDSILKDYGLHFTQSNITITPFGG